MVKKVFRSTLFVTLSILLSATLLIVSVLYSYFTRVQKGQLQTEAILVAQDVALESSSYFDTLNVSDLRTTWVDNEGNILYGSQPNATRMDSHANRREIREALKDGYGESTRYSATLATKSSYITQQLDGDTVIHLSIT